MLCQFGSVLFFEAIRVSDERFPGGLDASILRRLPFVLSENHYPHGARIEIFDNDGGVKRFPIADPFAALWMAVSECPNFAALLKQCLLGNPPSPENMWRIILYTDDVTPGDVLGPANKRKFVAVYWSLLELGINALCREEGWFTIMTEYLIDFSDVAAGMSQLFCGIIKSFFKPDGFNMSTTGINLTFGPDCLRLWAKLGVVLQDGAAHTVVWCSRGDTGSKVCLLCHNLFTSVSRVADEDDTNLLRSDVIKLDELVSATDEDLRGRARYLQSMHGTVNADEFNSLQQALGITHRPHSVLLDRSLDEVLHITKIFHHDTMHALFANGLCGLCVYLLFEAFITAELRNVYETFADYVSRWRWPSRVHDTNLAEIFLQAAKSNIARLVT